MALATAFGPVLPDPAGFAIRDGERDMPGIEIDGKGRAYKDKIAYAMGRAAKLAYAAPDAVQTEVAGWGLGDFAFFDKAGTQGFLAAGETEIVVAFRGTEPSQMEDWATDLNAGLVGGPGGRVHEGFSLALAMVWRDLLAKLLDVRERARLAGRRQTLWFTGHSLGAALATLAVAKLRLERDQPVNGLYTFGQPRTGDGDFARSFDADFGRRTFRVVHNNDVVPRVPPRLVRYSHVGQLIYFDADHKLQAELEWWEKLLDRMEGRWDDLFRPGTDGIKDHDMTQYLACLEGRLA